MIEELPELRRSILLYLKQHRSATIAELSQRLDVSYEGVRQQMAHMERDGWIASKLQRPLSRGAGRPVSSYTLTVAGEHLFPKQYDMLALELLGTVAGQVGEETLRRVLAALTEARVREWTPRLYGKTLTERVEMLKELYLEADPYMGVETDAGTLSLIERNCPFLNVAMRHPALCSVTVSTLARLLGVRVIREERFQNGQQRCAFRVLIEQPIDESFTFEFEPSAEGVGATS